MHGNVQEWCFDKAPKVDVFNCNETRGGSYSNVNSSVLRSAYKGRGLTFNRKGDIGFRIVRPY
jgi:formylglycine-generating enzyme required for sulfatase activity